MKALVIFSTGCICFGSTFAQSVSTLMGARQAAMGYASSASADHWSLFNNIGGLGKVKEKSIGVAYEAIPALVGANRMAVAVNLPTKWGGVGAGAFRFGDAIYSEQLLSAGVGNQFGITSLGVKINCIQYRAEGFGTRTAFSVDFGGITQLTKQISIGSYMTNLTQSAIQNKDGDRLPTQLVIGIGLQPSEKIFLVTEIQKDIDYKATWRTGLEYSIYKSLFVRTGYNFNPQAAFFGLGFLQKKLKVDYAIRLNEMVGTTHQASAVYLISSN